MGKERTAFYDNLKFILIALVVVGHFSGILINYDDTLKYIWRWIYLFHMPAFLFVGGMFAKKLYTPETGLKVNTIAFYLVMFVLFYTALWAYSFWWNPHPTYDLFNVGSIPWYFFVMAALGVSTPIIAKFKGGWKTVIPLSVALAIVAPLSSNMDDFLCLGRIFAYAPFYFAGYFIPIKPYVQLIGSLKSKVWPILCAVIAMVVVLVLIIVLPKGFVGTMSGLGTGHNPYSSFDAYGTQVEMLIKLLDIVIAAIMIFALSLVTPTRHCLISGLGARTLQVYVFHPFIYYPVTAFHVFDPLIPYVPYSGFAVILAATLLTALLAWPKWPENAFQALRKRIQADNLLASGEHNGKR